MTHPRTEIADALDRVVPDLDRLIADARVGTRSSRHDIGLADLEERAQAIAAAIIAPFRGKPVRPPLWREGNKAAW